MNSKATGITRKHLIIKAKKAEIKDYDKISDKDLANAYNRHIKKRKLLNIYKKFSRLAQKNIQKRPSPTKSDLRKAKTLYNKSLSDLQRLVRLRRIKNYDDMTKKDLIYTLLRSEKNNLEDSYMKYINITTDNELKDKINQIRISATKLGNALSKKEKKIIREELYKIERKDRHTKSQK